MDYSLENEAWITQRPDYMVYSTKPIIVFAVSGITLAILMSIGFLIFECCYAGFGRCHPHKPHKTMPKGVMNVIACCFGHGGWQLGWIFSTALFPAVLTSFLGIVLFEIVFITMPDIYSTVPAEAWIAFFALGFLVAFFSRFFLFNWYYYFLAWRFGRKWLGDVSKEIRTMDAEEEEEGREREDGVLSEDEFTPLNK